MERHDVSIALQNKRLLSAKNKCDARGAPRVIERRLRLLAACYAFKILKRLLAHMGNKYRNKGSPWWIPG